MKRLNAKKIAAVVTGAALLGFGLAVASPVTISNVQVINNAGQPTVQVVVGSLAKPSDGVAAGNIAAAIGNLAFTQTQKVFPANVTQAKSVLGVSVSSPSYSLTDQQVYFNETSSSVVSGAYSFSALIGSVLNRADKPAVNSPIDSTHLSGSSTYAYQETNVLTGNVPSAYTPAGGVPTGPTPSATSNGGGVTFAVFNNSNFDNIMRVTNTNLPSLLSNSGNNAESEYLWLTGFPVYDQASGVDSLALLSAGGAYQVVFGKPINPNNYTASTELYNITNAPISLLGQPWTIIASNSMIGGAYASASTSNEVFGGKITLASSLTNLSTVYVGDNLTTGPFKVQLAGLGNTNQSGISQASINIYYQNSTTPVNTTVADTNSMNHFNISGKTLWVRVGQTFVGGSFSYQRWAKMQLYANVYNINGNGGSFNKTNDPGWDVYLGWTNTTGTGNAISLKSIVIYNTTPTTLLPGQSFNFITNPAMWKLQFVGQTLSSSNYDPISATLSTGSETYENAPSLTGSGLGNIDNITEPAQLLTVTSSIPDAFTYGGQTSSSVLYDLTPYKLTETAVNSNTAINANAVITFPEGNFVQPTSTVTVTIRGAKTSTGGITQLFSGSISGNDVTTGNFPAYNVTSITLSRAIPGASVIVSANSASPTPMASLSSLSPKILYSVPSQSYLSSMSASSATYSPESTTFALTSNSPTAGNNAQKYFEYTMNEVAVSGHQSIQDQLGFAIYNSSTGITASPLFQLNTSIIGTRNNMTYVPTSGGVSNTINNAPVGFITQRGSKIASITPSSLTVDFAKSVDGLQFVVGPSSNTSVLKHFQIVGPVGIGNAVPNVANVTVSNVTAKISLSGTSTYNITGISKVVSMPENVTTPVLLTNLPTNPLVVLDTNAHGSEILVGSGYVNTLSATFQKNLNITNADLNVTGGKIIPSSSTSQILVAGYTAAQTTEAANSFISQLYAAAASS